MKLTVVNATTGQILRTVECPEDEAILQVRDGEKPVPGHFDHRTHYHDGADMVSFPPRPSSSHKWSWETKTWQADLAAARAAKWRQMKAARASAMEAPLVTPYGTFDADKDSRENITQTATRMQLRAQRSTASTVDFTLNDNTTVTLTAEQMVDVVLLLDDQVQGAYRRGRQVRAAIAAARTVQEIEAVTWAP